MASYTATQDPKRTIVDLTMAIEDARKVVWQGRGPREPMGQLWDNKQLDSGDLAWAIDKAYNPQVRAAARTLLAEWLGRPMTLETTRRFGPRVIEGSTYLEDEELQSIGMLGMAIGAGTVAFFMAIGQQLSNLFHQMSPWLIALGLASNLGAVATVAYYGKRQFDKFVSFRRGHLGEEKVVDVLRAALDHRWTIFHNLHLPNRKDDLDVVLVGPAGVWVLEIKSYGGTVRFLNGRWERRNKRGWSTLGENPSSQVTKNATRLNDYLKREGVVRYVERVVALSKPQPITNFDSPDIPIWLMPNIEEKVSALSTRHPPTEVEISRIVELFTKLAEKQLAVEAEK